VDIATRVVVVRLTNVVTVTITGKIVDRLTELGAVSVVVVIYASTTTNATMVTITINLV